MGANESRLLARQDEPASIGFRPIMAAAVALFGVVLYIAFRWGIGMGFVGAAAALAGLTILPNCPKK